MSGQIFRAILSGLLPNNILIFLLRSLFHLYGHLPCALGLIICAVEAGSSICCILDDQKLHNQLSFAPRVALDMALANPEAYLGSPESGLCAGQLDTAIAYQLLTEVKILLYLPHPRCENEAMIQKSIWTNLTFLAPKFQSPACAALELSCWECM